MAQDALGMIETKGLCTLLEAADAALKAANVTMTDRKSTRLNSSHW
jgi:ethanolamine utilization protein EutM